MAINSLEWITCFECGVNFQVSVPNIAAQIMPKSYYRHDRDSVKTKCPRCGTDIYVHIEY